MFKVPRSCTHWLPREFPLNYIPTGGFPGDTNGEAPVCQLRRGNWPSFNPWARKMPWRRAWQPSPACLPGESHGQEPDGLQSMGSQRVWCDWSNLAGMHICQQSLFGTRHMFYRRQFFHQQGNGSRGGGDGFRGSRALHLLCFQWSDRRGGQAVM